MKKIAIFGGSGMTGLCAVEHALKKGLVVRALARDPKRFPEELRQKIEIVEGDVLNLSDVEKTVEGVDGVVIVLGTRNDVRPTTVLSEGTKNIVTAMTKAGIKPVSACFSSFLFKLDQVPPVFKALTEDHVRMLEALKTSDRDWVAVCPPHIAGGGMQRPNFFAFTSHFCHTYAGPGALGTAAYVTLGVPAAAALALGWPVRNLFKRKTDETTAGKFEVKNGESPGRVISKYNLGAFLVEAIEKPEYYKQQVGIANTPLV